MATARITDRFSRDFKVEAESSEIPFVPVSKTDNPDTLPAVKHERTADTRGYFSFRNITFETDPDKIIAKKKILFLFGGRIGFQAMYDNKFYRVKPPGFRKKGTKTPDITKLLLSNFYFADGKKTLRLWSVGWGEVGG